MKIHYSQPRNAGGIWSEKIMQTQTNRVTQTDILRLVAEARKARSDALGELIAVGGRKLLSTLLRKIDAGLHLMLMSPVKHRLVK